MFFLARSALCIGLVAAAASTAGGPTLGAAFAGGTREAARAAGQACLRSADCLSIGADLLAPAVTPQPSAQAVPRVSPPGQGRLAPPRRAAGTRDGATRRG